MLFTRYFLRKIFRVSLLNQKVSKISEHEQEVEHLMLSVFPFIFQFLNDSKKELHCNNIKWTSLVLDFSLVYAGLPLIFRQSPIQH